MTMSLCVALLLTLLAAARADDCPDGTSCEGGTCCPTSAPNQPYGCCPFQQAVCCADGAHCCPNGYTCDLEQQMCVPNGLALGHRPVTSLGGGASVRQSDKCPDGKTSCGSGTCCKTVSGGYACCPEKNATCCEDHIHCCPSGTTCDVKDRTCVKKDKFLNLL